MEPDLTTSFSNLGINSGLSHNENVANEPPKSVSIQSQNGWVIVQKGDSVWDDLTDKVAVVKEVLTNGILLEDESHLGGGRQLCEITALNNYNYSAGFPAG